MKNTTCEIQGIQIEFSAKNPFSSKVIFMKYGWGMYCFASKGSPYSQYGYTILNSLAIEIMIDQIK